MTISFNSKKAQEQSFDRVPPGRYLCEVEDAQEKQASTGAAMISLRWRYMETGHTVCFDNLVFSEKGVGIAHKKLKAMGYPLPADGSDVDVAVEASDLIGLQAVLTLVEREYKGKKNLTPDFDAPGFGYESSSSTPPTARPAAGKAANVIAEAFDENIPF